MAVGVAVARGIVSLRWWCNMCCCTECLIRVWGSLEMTQAGPSSTGILGSFKIPPKLEYSAC